MNLREMLLAKHFIGSGGSGGTGGTGGGDASTLTKLIEGTVPVELVDNQATVVRAYAFHYCPNLISVDLPAVTSIGNNAFLDCSVLTTANFLTAKSIGNYAFENCAALTTVDFPAATSIGNNAFNKCKALTTANIPALTSVNPYVFSNCAALTTVDFPVVTSIATYAFYSCKALTTLILRNTAKVATLSNVIALESTPIASGTGYIYVPKSLLSDTTVSKDYRRATNWSTYAAQFRALEDYTVDGTVTGELDPTKI